MGKIGLGGLAILALILFFILVPWHNANDPVPANGERPGLLTTWWRLGQPTRPTEEAVPVSRPTATPAEVATAVAPKPVAKATPKAQGPKKIPTPKAAKQPQPTNRPAEVKPQYINFAQAMSTVADE